MSTTISPDPWLYIFEMNNMNQREECFMSHDFNRKGIKDIMTEEIYLNHPIILSTK